MDKGLDGSAGGLTEPSAQCTVETAIVYKLRKFRPESFCWADITIRAWKGGVSFQAQSDYGNYAYIWGAIGPDDWRDFLLSLDYGYFMGKAHPSHGYETDWDGTADDIRKLILEDRRKGRAMSAEEARACFDAVDKVEWGPSIYYELRDYPELAEFMQSHDFPTKRARNGQCNGFWSVVWPEICKVWRKEKESEANEVSAAKPQQDSPAPAEEKGKT